MSFFVQPRYHSFCKLFFEIKYSLTYSLAKYREFVITRRLCSIGPQPAISTPDTILHSIDPYRIQLRTTDCYRLLRRRSRRPTHRQTARPTAATSNKLYATQLRSGDCLTAREPQYTVPHCVTSGQPARGPVQLASSPSLSDKLEMSPFDLESIRRTNEVTSPPGGEEARCRAAWRY